MKFFHRLGEGNDFTGLLNAVMRQPELWNQNSLRTKTPNSPHAEAEDIILRFTPFLESDPGSIMERIECENTPAFLALPQSRVLIFNLMHLVEGEQLGRVMITKLAPGHSIHLHKDEGGYARFYDRYHFVLQGLPGSLFNAGNETVGMKTGDVWWFDNAQLHQVVNNSADDRIHMIVDIHTTKSGRSQ